MAGLNLAKAVELNLDTLGELDSGAARHAIDAALRQALSDIEDRGLEDGKARKVTVEIELKKISDDFVEMFVKTKCTMPAYQTAKTHGVLQKDPYTRKVGVKFQPYSPENPEQDSIPFGEGEVDTGA